MYGVYGVKASNIASFSACTEYSIGILTVWMLMDDDDMELDGLGDAEVNRLISIRVVCA